MTLLSVSGLRGGYGTADEIVKGVTLRVEPGEVVALIGPNGAGKSTLLKLIAGLLRPREGHVRLRDREIAGLDAPSISRLGLAFVPQERNVFGAMTVGENLEMGGYLDTAHLRRRRDELYERFPMLAEKRRAAARTLSGGQRQILAMAVALMNAPTVLLLDEPTAGLSPDETFRTGELIQRLNAEGATVLVVEHDMAFVRQIATSVTVLHLGRVFARGTIDEIIANRDVEEIYLGSAHDT